MGRRKKEPRGVHRENIASAAAVLKMKLYFFQRHFEIERIFFLVPYQFLADKVINICDWAPVDI